MAGTGTVRPPECSSPLAFMLPEGTCDDVAASLYDSITASSCSKNSKLLDGVDERRGHAQRSARQSNAYHTARKRYTHTERTTVYGVQYASNTQPCPLDDAAVPTKITPACLRSHPSVSAKLQLVDRCVLRSFLPLLAPGANPPSVAGVRGSCPASTQRGQKSVSVRTASAPTGCG